MGRTRLQTVALATTALLAMGAAGCGDDDEGAAPGTTERAPDTGAFCDALVAFNSGLNEHGQVGDGSPQADLVAAGEQLDPLAKALAGAAPAELSGYADELADAVAALLQGDSAAFGSDEIVSAYPGFVRSGTQGCEFESVPVRAVDYAFEGVPESVPAGTVTFDMTNASTTEPHELLVFHRAPSEERPIEELLALPEEELFGGGALEMAAFTVAEPGGEGTALVQLEAGRYELVCLLPVAGAGTGETHVDRRMFTELTVE